MGARDQVDEGHRGQTRDRPHDDGPDDLRGVESVRRYDVGRPVGEVDPGDGGGDRRGRERRQHERQSERSQEHLQREQGSAQRHVVDGGDPRTRPAGDEQTPLPVGQAVADGQQARQCRAGLLGRGLATERRSQSDGHDRVERIGDALDERQPRAVQPQRLGDVHPPRQAREQRAGDAGEQASDEQHEHPAQCLVARHTFEEVAGVIGPGQMLDGVQEQHQASSPKSRTHADRHDQPPEADPVAGGDPASGHVWLGGGGSHANPEFDGRPPSPTGASRRTFARGRGTWASALLEPSPHVHGARLW